MVSILDSPKSSIVMRATRLKHETYSFSLAPLLRYWCFMRRASHETANRTAYHRYCWYRESDRKLDL